MGTMIKPATTRPRARRRQPATASRPADLEAVDWDFRIEPPTPKRETVKVRFVQGGQVPFTARPVPRD